MPRYGSDQKPATRRRILDAAGARLKAHGVDGSGVAVLMGDAGLTNGAFYAHFASKDDLVASVVADQLDHQREVLRSDAEDPGSIERFVRAYLSPAHRDDPSAGCPSAALLPEIARGSTATRQAYTEGVLGLVDDLAPRLGLDDPEAARALLLQCLGVMAGTLQLARALEDTARSDALLDDGVRTVLGLLAAAR